MGLRAVREDNAGDFEFGGAVFLIVGFDFDFFDKFAGTSLGVECDFNFSGFAGVYGFLRERRAGAAALSRSGDDDERSVAVVDERERASDGAVLLVDRAEVVRGGIEGDEWGFILSRHREQSYE